MANGRQPTPRGCRRCRTDSAPASAAIPYSQTIACTSIVGALNSNLTIAVSQPMPILSHVTLYIPPNRYPEAAPLDRQA